MSAALSTGTYWVDAACPRCGQLEPLAVVLSAVLTTPDDDVPSLRLRAKSKATDHFCGQRTLPFTAPAEETTP